MLLAVDVGNTKIKVAVFEGSNLIERFDFYSSELQNQIEFTLNKYQSISDLVVASVGNIPKEAFLVFEKNLLL
jgi:type III pantothenate kinase